jgi:hypothetical protein
MMATTAMASVPGGAGLLAMWEGVLARPALARGDALLYAAGRDDGPARLPGERNARLASLHAQLFGRTLELLSHCPACGTAVQFGADCEALAAQAAPPAHPAPHRLEANGHVIEFRLPGNLDIAQVAAEACDQGDEQFARLLLERCVLGCRYEGAEVPVATLPVPVLDALSDYMEALDPGASVAFALACPQCLVRWQAPLDVGEALWQKVRTAAEHLLLDIDTLARAYGWTEREVLRLSPLRRAAYLQMVTS